MTPAAATALRQCYSILGAEKKDPMRCAWDLEMAPRDRRYLLKTAGLPCELMASGWDRLTPEARSRIRYTARRIKAWADRLGIPGIPA